MSKKNKKNGRRLKNRIWFRIFGSVSKVPCHWCSTPLSFSDTTLDHYPALSEGGTWNNAVLSCYDCNQKRGRLTSIRLNIGKIDVRLTVEELEYLLDFLSVSCTSEVNELHSGIMARIESILEKEKNSIDKEKSLN